MDPLRGDTKRKRVKRTRGKRFEIGREQSPQNPALAAWSKIRDKTTVVRLGLKLYDKNGKISGNRPKIGLAHGWLDF